MGGCYSASDKWELEDKFLGGNEVSFRHVSRVEMTNKQLVFEFKVKVGFGNSLHVGFEAVKYIFVSENMLTEKRAWASILGGLVRTDEIEEELLEG